MPGVTPTRLADARQVRALRQGATGAFYEVWNGLAGQVWSVLVGVFDSEAEAEGWAMTFRIELASRLSGFSLDQSLSVQVGLLLVDHLRTAITDGDTPVPQREPDSSNDTLRALPAVERLNYLVGLFFEVEAVGEQPEANPDERAAARTLLFRVPPPSILLRPPGSDVPAGRWRGWVSALLLFSGVGLSAWWFTPRAPTWSVFSANHEAVLAGPIVIGSDPAELATSLARQGVRGSLIEAPDLTLEGLSLVGAAAQHIGDDAEAVVVVYARGAEVWTLQHTRAPLPPERNGSGLIFPTLTNHTMPPFDLVGWVEAGGSWVLCGPTGGDSAALALRIRDRRRAPSLDL